MIELHDRTDEMIRSALDALPSDHYSRQWYADALGSDCHPQRRANARRLVCDAINTRDRVCHHSLCGNHYTPGRCGGQCPDGSARKAGCSRGAHRTT